MTVKFSAFTAQAAMGDTDKVVGLHSTTNSIWTGLAVKTYVSASPTLVTPVLGVATVTTLNKVTITAPASAATLTIVDGKTLTVSKTLSFTGTDSTVMTFPTTSATIARTDAAQSFTGVQTFVAPILGTPTSGTLTNCTLPVGGVTGLGTGVATFLATPTSANLASAVTNETGSGALVFATSPTLVTPVLGTPASGALDNCVFPDVDPHVAGAGYWVLGVLTKSAG